MAEIHERLGRKETTDLEPIVPGRGKRSDPEFESSTVFLRKGNKKLVYRLLEDMDSDLDMSSLIDLLLRKWIAENSQIQPADAGIDLKTKILEVLRNHPAQINPDVVYHALVDFASALAVARHSEEARDFWMKSFDVAQSVGATTGAGK